MRAEDIVEQLRYGIPPSGATLQFTVGREDQIRQLGESLEDLQNRSLLIHANYGAGKSHLLHVLQELALKRGFAVAFIVADANGGVRFDRMDTVLGDVCREIQVPGMSGKGIGILFDAYQRVNEAGLDEPARADRERISNGNRWDNDHYFSLWSPGIYVALRAWLHSSNDQGFREYIQYWLEHPYNYRGRRQDLYVTLVRQLRGCFRDPRPRWRFMNDNVLSFHTNDYSSSWAALRDFDLLARCSGCRGLVLLVDEFEDVIYNLPRLNNKQEAFRNLFRVFAGREFLGQSYFAVTPDFTLKCRRELLKRGVYGNLIDTRGNPLVFNDLPCFQLDPISVDDVVSLSKKIRDVHSRAYGWRAEEEIDDKELDGYCVELMRTDSPNKIREVVTSVVALFDERLDLL